jgi:acyl dehydratase
MEPTAFEGIEALKGAVGQDLGPSDWLEITQDRINLFADATGDRQWIHVDPARAAAGPFGTTIGHGFLTLSLVANLMPQVIRVQGISMGVNYGTNKVRFPTPVPVGSRIRARGHVQSVEDVPGGVQVVNTVTIEIEGKDKPACVVETVSRYLV